MRYLPAVLAAMALTTPLTAEEDARWRVIVSNEDAVRFFDTRTITAIDTVTYRVWVRESFRRSQQFPDRVRYASSTELMELDCASRSWRMMAGVYHDRDGEVVTR